MRGYKDLIAVFFPFSSFQWGSIDTTQVLIDSSTAIPDSVTTTSQLISASLASGSGSRSYTFYSPEVFDLVSDVDGMLSGNVTIYSQVASSGTSTARVDITGVSIALYKKNEYDDNILLKYYKIYDGTYQTTLGQTKRTGMMFWLPISGSSIGQNERLSFTVTINYTSVDTANTTGRYVGICISAADKETMISLPFVI